MPPIFFLSWSRLRVHDRPRQRSATWSDHRPHPGGRAISILDLEGDKKLLDAVPFESVIGGLWVVFVSDYGP